MRRANAGDSSARRLGRLEGASGSLGVRAGPLLHAHLVLIVFNVRIVLVVLVVLVVFLPLLRRVTAGAPGNGK